MNLLKKIFFLTILLFNFLLSICLADTSLSVTGNSRISIQTIKEIISFDKNLNYNDPLLLNEVQTKLSTSGFFKEIFTNYSNNSLNLKLTENPLIDFFYIKGVKNKQREDFLYKNLKLKPNTIFTNDKLKKDIETIKSVFSESGYLDVKVVPTVSEMKNKLVNIVIDIDRGQKFLISRFYFIGDKYFKSSILNDVILSSEYGWWKFLSSTSSLNLKRLDYDKRLLKNFYLNNGFYDAQIISSDVTLDKNKNVIITFSINSGLQYKFNKISISDSDKSLSDNDNKFLQNYVNKKLKGIFSAKKVQDTKVYIENYLIEKKVEFVDVDYQLLKNDLSDQKINLTYSLKSDSKKYVRLINVKGNSITEEKVIRDNLNFSEGDSYMKYKLIRSIDNLRSLGIFKSVNYNFIENSSKDLVDIDIRVEEQPTGQISAGLGIGTSNSSISTGIEEKNLFGKGINVSSAISFGTEKVAGKVNVKLPKYGVNEKDVYFNFGVTETDYDNGSYNSKKAETGLAQSYEIYEDIFLTTGINYDLDRIETDATASSYIKSLDGSYNTFKAFYSVQNDKRNRKFNTSSGYIMNFNQAYAVPGSDIQYISNNISGLYYYPLTKDYTFNIKSGVSTINATNGKNIKLSDRLGLSNKKLRGFEPRGIGPKDGDNYIGGNYSAYLGFSSSFPNPLPDKWNANTIVFLDSGNVWGVDYDNSKDSSKLRSSIGISLDWTSPLGPLSFTFAQVLSSSDSDSEEAFSFQLGSSF